LRSYAGKAYVHRPSIVIYQTFPEVTPDGDEDEKNGTTTDWNCLHFKKSFMGELETARFGPGKGSDESVITTVTMAGSRRMYCDPSSLHLFRAAIWSLNMVSKPFYPL
jgi:hypothetical protein